MCIRDRSFIYIVIAIEQLSLNNTLNFSIYLILALVSFFLSQKIIKVDEKAERVEKIQDSIQQKESIFTEKYLEKSFKLQAVTSLPLSLNFLY